ncbi:MAG TPA: TetR/AcrR family transcriptional regulator [Trichocoleus sp.]
MNDAPKRAAGRPRSAKSHQAILQATVELLAEVGFDGLSMGAIATRAGVGKTTIYRRYRNKEELVADAIESLREELDIPDTGTLWDDIQKLIESAAKISLTPVGRKTVAMIMSSAASNPKFAQIYWEKYLSPRRQAFAVVIERAQARNEVQAGLDPGLVFDAMSGIMLYGLIFQPTSESWEAYVRRSLELILRDALD